MHFFSLRQSLSQRTLASLGGRHSSLHFPPPESLAEDSGVSGWQAFLFAGVSGWQAFLLARQSPLRGDSDAGRASPKFPISNFYFTFPSPPHKP